MNIKVLKRDGTTEDFLPEKIIRVVMAAGLDENQALSLAADISDWAKNLKTSQITSRQIRDQVVAGLGKYSSYARGLYTWYESTKDSKSS